VSLFAAILNYSHAIFTVVLGQSFHDEAIAEIGESPGHTVVGPYRFCRVR
jgi:hypothetical protein